MNIFQTFDSADTYWAYIQNQWSDAQPKRCIISGGSAAQVLNHLPEATAAAWWLADERCVPHDHEDSNTALIQSFLGNGATLHSPEMKCTKPACNADLYEKCMPESWDHAFLGVGPDGHIASLFPAGSGTLIHTSPMGLTAHTTTSRFAVKNRITLTKKALLRCASISLLLIGTSKKGVYEMLQQEGNTPAHQLLQAHKNIDVLWCM